MKKIIIIAVSIILSLLLFFFGIIFFGNKSIKKANQFVSKVEEIINSEEIKNDVCIIERDGNLLCEDKTIIIDNTQVKSGQIVIIDGKISSIDIVIDNKNFINVDNAIIVNNKKNEKTFIKGDQSGAEIPLLYTNNLIPVIHNGTNWIVADTNNEWYNYDIQKWANAVILKPGVTKEVNDIVNVDSEVQGMFVWIPRFEYKIDGQYGRKTGEYDGTQLSPGIIDINFISKNTSVAKNGYTIPSAFYHNGKELSGIWVSKFNTSTSKNNECYNADLNMTAEDISSNYSNIVSKCNTVLIPYVLPNVRTLRYQNAYNQYSTAAKLNLYVKNMDSHMSKNSEYAAIIYFTESKYGKYGNQDYIDNYRYLKLNNNANYITGCGGSEIYSTISLECNEYVTSYGMESSTTGNITGVYDINGVTRTRVMGYLDADFGIETTNDIKSTGFTDKPDSKYANIFLLKENIVDYDEFNMDEVESYIKAVCSSDNCISQGLNEFYRWGENEDSYTYKFPTIENPWIIRGGINQFNFISDRGITQSDITFRITLVDNQ